jgi:hypothetical protein
MYRILIAFIVFLIGCGGGTVESTASQGGSASTTTATAGSGGAGGTGGEVPCVEPTPEGWAGPLQGYAPDPGPLYLTVIPDEAGGLAGTGPRLGPFVCAHDFDSIGVAYYGDLFPEVVHVAIVFGGADGAPIAPPFAGDASVVTGEAFLPAPVLVEGLYTMTLVDLASVVHVEPGDVVYPVAQVDDGVGVLTSDALTPNPSWYYAPPGSGAGGPSGLWAALDQPPPGVPSYKWPVVVRPYEVAK